MARGLVPTVIATSLVVVPPGCAPPQEREAPALTASSAAVDERMLPPEVLWPYWPTDMRIHPLTRLATAAGDDRPVIEARVEMRDRDGHTSKACGLVTLDLYDAGDESPTGSRAVWNLDLRDPDVNRKHFDDVTLTYLFKLEIEPSLLPDDPVLWAYLLADDGAELSARYELRR